MIKKSVPLSDFVRSGTAVIPGTIELMSKAVGKHNEHPSIVKENGFIIIDGSPPLISKVYEVEKFGGSSMMELQPEGQTFKVNSFDSTRAAFILFVHLSTKPVDYKTIAPAKT